MRSKTLYGLRIALGIVLILLGLIGLLIPLLQGWLLIFAGIFLIKPAYGRKIKERMKGWWEKKFQSPKSK